MYILLYIITGCPQLARALKRIIYSQFTAVLSTTTALWGAM